MKRKSSGPALVFILLAIMVCGLLQRTTIFPFWSKNYSPKQEGVPETLSPEYILFAMAGFRELIAGILWVRADSFFETGNYDAVLPIIRLVTWLDPKQIDVYATGMWHIGYNFTDEQHRSDRRYLPSAVALGKEGARRNSETYEMFFETGWLWFHKINDDYNQAVSYWEQAGKRADMDLTPARRNLLANAYLRDGQIDHALRYYYELLDAAEKKLKSEPGAYNNFSNKETIEKNLDVHLVRMTQRGWFAEQRGDFEQSPYDSRPPWDVKFSVRVTVEKPKVLWIQGTWNVLPVGTRIRVVLRDMDFEHAVPAGIDWDWKKDVTLDPPLGQTYMQDELFVRNRRFNRQIDMSRDVGMYPFKQDRYLLEFYYNPRSAAHHIQDKFSWNGEGMTDEHYLNTKIKPGVRVIYTTLELTKDQLLRVGEWSNEGGKTPVVQTPNFKPAATTLGDSDIVKVPNLRASP